MRSAATQHWRQTGIHRPAQP
ncbi:protein of unknown function [Cupriavidus taiwanensis]|nr:protein of unknown function [Cupriavidus taiwanensis]